MDNRQYREELIKEMVAAYRDVRRLDRKLKSKTFQRVFKNPSCPTAIKINEARLELLGHRQEAWECLQMAFNRLPEVRSLDEKTEIGLGPMAFAAKCAAKPKGIRFMKNQLAFTS